MKINKFVIETFQIDTNAAAGSITDQGAISQAGTDFGDVNPKGGGFGSISKFTKDNSDYDDLHANIYMTSSIDIEPSRFAYSGSLSAHGEVSEGVHIAAHGIFISEIE